MKNNEGLAEIAGEKTPIIEVTERDYYAENGVQEMMNIEYKTTMGVLAHFSEKWEGVPDRAGALLDIKQEMVRLRMMMEATERSRAMAHKYSLEPTGE